MANRIDGRWFTSTLRDRRISQRQLAKLMGVDPASIHRLFTGKRPMRLDEATALSKLLDKPVGEILDHAGVPLQTADTVPVAGWVDGVGEVHLEPDEQTERVPGLAGMAGNTFALRAQTGGTALQFLDGWLFYVELPLRNGEIGSDVIGRYCLVELESGARLMRWVRRGYKRGTWNLDGNFGAPSIASATLTAATPVLGIRPA